RTPSPPPPPRRKGTRRFLPRRPLFFPQPQLVRASAPKCFSVLQLGKRLRCRSHRGIEPRILASGQQSRGKGMLRAHPPTLRAKRGDDMLVHRDVVEIAERMLQRFKRRQEFLALLCGTLARQQG